MKNVSRRGFIKLTATTVVLYLFGHKLFARQKVVSVKSYTYKKIGELSVLRWGFCILKRIIYANCMQIKNKQGFQFPESLFVIDGEDGSRTHDLLTAM